MGEGGVVDLPHPTGGITMAHRLVMTILIVMTVLHHLTDLRRPLHSDGYDDGSRRYHRSST